MCTCSQCGTHQSIVYLSMVFSVPPRCKNTVSAIAVMCLQSKRTCCLMSCYFACCALTVVPFFAMQNPVVTLAWLFGNLQLLAPFISLTVDTNLFCVSPLHTKPTLVLSVATILLAYVAILTRLGSFNPLNFFNFSQSFRLQFGGQCLGGIIVYTTYITLFRRLVLWHKRRRLSPT